MQEHTGYYATRAVEFDQLDGYAGAVRINEGEWVRDGHPAVASQSGAFESDSVRKEQILRLATQNPGMCEAGASFHQSNRTARRSNPASELRARALDANERADFLPDAAREHMARTLQVDDDPESRLARYTVELSDRDYFRAFAKWMRDPVSGGHEWSPAEREAVQRVRHVERAMSLISGGN